MKIIVLIVFYVLSVFSASATPVEKHIASVTGNSIYNNMSLLDNSRNGVVSMTPEHSLQLAQGGSAGGSAGRGKKDLSGTKIGSHAKKKRRRKNQKKPSKRLGLSASWLGMKSDRVGKGSQATPNGQVDGRIRLVVRTGGKRLIVTYILLSGGIYGLWDTAPNWWWILGVMRNGRRLNPSDINISDVVEGKAIYDLYANDNGTFSPQRPFSIEVRFANGSKLSTIVTVR